MPQQHVVDRYMETIAHMGVSNDQQGLDYFIPSQTKVEAVLDSPFIAWSLGGSFVQKKLEVQQVADACKKISLPIFLLGGPEEAADAEAIMEACGQQNIQNFCGKLSLDQTALLIKNCRLLLSNDTGLMHIGAAFKKSIISFGVAPNLVWDLLHMVPQITPYKYFLKFRINHAPNMEKVASIAPRAVSNLLNQKK